MIADRYEAFLAAPCPLGGWHGKSWRDWMIGVFTLLIDEADSFSGKRPGCDSGWSWPLAEDLALYLDEAIVEPPGAAEALRQSRQAGESDFADYDVNWQLVSKRFNELLVYAFSARA